MVSLWKKMRGYKRHAGAIVMALVLILPLFGVEIPEDIMTSVKWLGTAIFGLGWLDAGARVLRGDK